MVMRLNLPSEGDTFKDFYGDITQPCADLIPGPSYRAMTTKDLWRRRLEVNDPTFGERDYSFFRRWRTRAVRESVSNSLVTVADAAYLHFDGRVRIVPNLPQSFARIYPNQWSFWRRPSEFPEFTLDDVLRDPVNTVGLALVEGDENLLREYLALESRWRNRLYGRDYKFELELIRPLSPQARIFWMNPVGGKFPLCLPYEIRVENDKGVYFRSHFIGKKKD